MVKKIFLDGEIGLGINTAEGFNQRLKALNLQEDDVLMIVVDSPGGSVFDGFKIFNSIIDVPNKKIAKVTSMAASIASLIVMAADEIEMNEVSLFMIHKSSSFVAGNADQIKQQTGALIAIDEAMTDTFQNRTGQEREQIEAWLSDETWFTPAEALEFGFIDRINSINQNPNNMSKKKIDAFKAIMARLVGPVANAEPILEPINDPAAAPAVDPTAAAPTEPAAAEPGTEPNADPNAPAVEFVTMEMFQAFKDEVLAALAELGVMTEETQAEIEELPATIEDVITAKFTTKGKGPVAGASANVNTPAASYEDRHKSFRDRQKAREEATRIKN